MYGFSKKKIIYIYINLIKVHITMTNKILRPKTFYFFILLLACII